MRVQGSGFRGEGSGVRVQGSGVRVQGSGVRVQGSGGGFAAFLEESILDTQPSPRGEGAPKGRIGQHYGISHIVR